MTSTKQTQCKKCGNFIRTAPEHQYHKYTCVECTPLKSDKTRVCRLLYHGYKSTLPPCKFYVPKPTTSYTELMIMSKTYRQQQEGET